MTECVFTIEHSPNTIDLSELRRQSYSVAGRFRTCDTVDRHPKLTHKQMQF